MKPAWFAILCLVGCGGDAPKTAQSPEVQNVVALLRRCPSPTSKFVKGEREKLVRCLLVAADNDLATIYTAGREFRNGDIGSNNDVLLLLNRVVFDVPRGDRGQGIWPLDVQSGRLILISSYPGNTAGLRVSFEDEFEQFRRKFKRRDLSPYRRQKLEGFVDPPLRRQSTLRGTHQPPAPTPQLPKLR